MLESNNFIGNVVISGGYDIFQLCLQVLVEEEKMIFSRGVFFAINRLYEFRPPVNKRLKWRLKDQSLQCRGDSFVPSVSVTNSEL